MNIFFSFLTAISPSYVIYAALRLLTGLSAGAMGPCSFVLATEPVGPSKRGAAGMSVFYFFSLGTIVLSAVAYAFPSSWRALYLISALPDILYLLAVLPWVSESPRWYLIRGKPWKALEVMKLIAQRNGNHLPTGISLVLDNMNSQVTIDTETKQDASGSIIDIVRSPVTCTRLVISSMINFQLSIVYYGLTLNVVNLNTNLYANVALNAVAEMPSFALTTVLLNWLGRKPMTVATLWFSGAFCPGGSFVQNAVVRMVFGAIGIFGVSATFNLVLIYVAELFPTVARNAAIACVHQAAQTAAIVAPMVVVMGGQVAFTIFAICGVTGGLLAFCLPETLNRPLYDTFEGMEEERKQETVANI